MRITQSSRQLADGGLDAALEQEMAISLDREYMAASDWRMHVAVLRQSGADILGMPRSQ